MKKVLYFIFLFLTIVGIIGGIGYSIYCGAWYIALGLAVVGLVAYPGVKILYKKLVE